jgi:hypothetical protein
MSAEFYITFENPLWFVANKSLIEKKITSLSTFSKNNTELEYWLAGTEVECWLTGTEPRRAEDWDFDVRLFIQAERIFFDVSSHPVSVEQDMSSLFSWLRHLTDIQINDDDGEPSGW